MDGSGTRPLRWLSILVGHQDVFVLTQVLRLWGLKLFAVSFSYLR